MRKTAKEIRNPIELEPRRKREISMANLGLFFVIFSFSLLGLSFQLLEAMALVVQKSRWVFLQVLRGLRLFLYLFFCFAVLSFHSAFSREKESDG